MVIFALPFSVTHAITITFLSTKNLDNIVHFAPNMIEVSKSLKRAAKTKAETDHASYIACVGGPTTAII